MVYFSGIFLVNPVGLRGASSAGSTALGLGKIPLHDQTSCYIFVGEIKAQSSNLTWQRRSKTGFWSHRSWLHNPIVPDGKRTDTTLSRYLHRLGIYCIGNISNIVHIQLYLQAKLLSLNEIKAWFSLYLRRPLCFAHLDFSCHKLKMR